MKQFIRTWIGTPTAVLFALGAFGALMMLIGTLGADQPVLAGVGVVGLWLCTASGLLVLQVYVAELIHDYHQSKE